MSRTTFDAVESFRSDIVTNDPANDNLPQQEFFHHVYGDSPAPWELDMPQPALEQAVAPGGVFANYVGRGVRVLDLCCGTGQNSLLLARMGCTVTGVDMNEVALSRARRAYESQKAQDSAADGSAQFVRCDLLNAASWPESMHGNFDVVLDSAAFHCFSLENRDRYMQSWSQATHAGARLLFLNFCDPPPRQGVGPRRPTERELRDEVFIPAQGWELEHLEKSGYFHNHNDRGVPAPQPAWLAVARRVATTNLSTVQ